MAYNLYLVIILSFYSSGTFMFCSCYRQETEMSMLEHNVPQTGDYKSYTWHIFAGRGKSCGSNGLIVPQGDFHVSLRACVNHSGYFRSPSHLSDSKSTGGLEKIVTYNQRHLPLCLITDPQRLSSWPQITLPSHRNRKLSHKTELDEIIGLSA